ncbi:interferon-inducible GTPase 1-like [Mercenaria mercenaria]|uniref:interferon-inducible GTPase 1-like n=1 Tax=Mercenaria mercenaria TaxID=6596 RepID=UPI00234F0B14|nr:interferon-inducible GTPase 1-like [Mercenaria mercenaria]
MASRSGNCAVTSDEISDILEIEDDVKVKHGTTKGNWQWEYTQINIAVIGQGKSGKSSFINHIRNVKPGDREAAEVGVTVEENVAREYQHPNNPKISLWELPGLEIKDVKQSTDFDKYDFFLILSEKTFMEIESWIVTEISKRDKQFYFIRTCVGRSIKETPGAHNKSKICEDIKVSCKCNLERNGIDNPVIFLIDSYDKVNNYFEFGVLQDQLITVAESTKQGEIPFSFDFEDTDLLMNTKKQMLASRICQKGLEAARAKSTVETNSILKQEIILQQRIFGIDRENLNKYQTTFQLPSNSVEKFMIVFDKETEMPESNVITLVDGYRGFAGVFRKGADILVRTARRDEMSYIYKQCVKILDGSLQMVFDCRDGLKKHVLTHLLREKRKEKLTR